MASLPQRELRYSAGEPTSIPPGNEIIAQPFECDAFPEWNVQTPAAAANSVRCWTSRQQQTGPEGATGIAAEAFQLGDNVLFLDLITLVQPQGFAFDHQQTIVVHREEVEFIAWRTRF